MQVLEEVAVGLGLADPVAAAKQARAKARPPSPVTPAATLTEKAKTR
jgi:hypothetical protein